MSDPKRKHHRLLLGSASPRRRKILSQMGLRFDVVVPEDEEVSHETDPDRTVRGNAALKSAWCRRHHPDRCSLTADTVVAFKGRCVEKPVSMDQAREFLHMLSGQRHDVLTATAFALPRGEPEVVVTTSGVTFKPLTDADIDLYFEKVNPLDKAGGYDIDQHGEIFIARHEGSWTNIMGLPEEVVAAWLARHPEYAS
jgi:septum formation protein